MSGSATGRNLLIAAAVIVIGTLVAAMWIMESPSKQRDRRIDQRRVEQLDAISDAIDAWARVKGSMPSSLAELAGQPGASLVIVDPVVGAPYGYEVTAIFDYTLCATFATSTSDRGRDAKRYRPYDNNWMHPAGRKCFERRLGQMAIATVSAAAENRQRANSPSP